MATEMAQQQATLREQIDTLQDLYDQREGEINKEQEQDILNYVTGEHSEEEDGDLPDYDDENQVQETISFIKQKINKSRLDYLNKYNESLKDES